MIVNFVNIIGEMIERRGLNGGEIIDRMKTSSL
jgi:hypothetical protein